MNEYGLDANYFAEKLKIILRDISRYTPAEMARELARLSVTSDKSVLGEDEFKQSGWIQTVDRPPPYEEPVMVVWRGVVQHITYEYDSSDDGGWFKPLNHEWNEYARMPASEATHWMPLPKPPEAINATQQSSTSD